MSSLDASIANMILLGKLLLENHIWGCDTERMVDSMLDTAKVPLASDIL